MSRKTKKQQRFGLTRKQYEKRKEDMKWISTHLKVFRADSAGIVHEANEPWLEYVIMNEYLNIEPVKCLWEAGFVPYEIRFWIIYYLQRSRGAREDIAKFLLEEAKNVRNL